MTTGGSDDNNESAAQEDSAFQQEMHNIGARVPPGRMGKADDLASVSLKMAPAKTGALTLSVDRAFLCSPQTITFGV